MVIQDWYTFMARKTSLLYNVDSMISNLLNNSLNSNPNIYAIVLWFLCIIGTKDKQLMFKCEKKHGKKSADYKWYSVRFTTDIAQ